MNFSAPMTAEIDKVGQLPVAMVKERVLNN